MISASPATSPPAKPPPGLLCPENSRNTEKIITVWNIRRVATSKITDRRWGAMVEAAEIQSRNFEVSLRSRWLPSKPPDHTLTSPAREERRISPERWRRKMSEATPVAAASNTEISPIVRSEEHTSELQS